MVKLQATEADTSRFDTGRRSSGVCWCAGVLVLLRLGFTRWAPPALDTSSGFSLAAASSTKL